MFIDSYYGRKSHYTSHSNSDYQNFIEILVKNHLQVQKLALITMISASDAQNHNEM